MTFDRTPTSIEISPLFDVCQTQYGRACFAKEPIPRGTPVLETNTGLGSAVLYEFRKEVCATCFRYQYGKYAKVKLLKPEKWKGKFQGAGVWFCSEECMDQWKDQDEDDVLTTAYETMLTNYQMKSKETSEEVDEKANEIFITREVISQNWEEVNEWESRLQKMKKSKHANQLPPLNEEEYATARFVALTLYNTLNNHPSTEVFEELQSNELEKVSKYPVLLKSQTYVYKFLKISLPDTLQSLLSTDKLRLILGREYGNSFGVRQITKEGSDENKEFLGYMMSPEASFFNHSCHPNLAKERVKDHMVFKTTKDIQQGEQLCIDYFQLSEENYEERQKALAGNWFFYCKCDRCVEEEKEITLHQEK